MKEIEELEELAIVTDVFRKFWAHVRGTDNHLPACAFEGGEEDLFVLSYCIYEVGFPDDDSHLVSLIWANVMRRATPLVWAKDESGNIALKSPGDQFPRFLFYPHSNLLELLESSVTQFDTFEVLTEKLLAQMCAAGYELNEIASLVEIVIGLESDSEFSLIDFYSTLKLDIRTHNKRVHGTLDKPRIP